MSTRSTGRTARLVTAFATFAILAATLTPIAFNGNSTGVTCFLCGDDALADALQNMLLFAPLGVGLAMLGLSLPRAIGLCCAFSLGVELAQYTIVPGRDATISDVVANTLGGAVGFVVARRVLLGWRWSAADLFRVRAAVVLAWLTLCGLVASAFRPMALEGPYAVKVPMLHQQPLPSAPAASVEFRVNGRSLPEGRLLDDPGLTNDLRSAPLSAEVRLWLPVANGRGTLVRVDSRGGTVLLMLRRGADLLCRRHLLANTLRIRGPIMRLRNAFPLETSDDSSARLTLSCRFDRLDYEASSANSTFVVRGSARLTFGLGWSLFIPVTVSSVTSVQIARNACWLLLVAFPLGLVFSFTSPDRDRSGVRPLFGPPTYAVILLVLASAAALTAIFGVAPSPWWEYAAGIVGVVLGALAARLMQRTA